MDDMACHAQNNLPTLREMDIQNLIPPSQDASRLVPMAKHPPRRSVVLVHPDVMEIGSSPPGPCDNVRFPTMDCSNGNVFQPFGTRSDSIDRFIPWSMPPPIPHLTHMGGYYGHNPYPNDLSSAQMPPRSDMGDTERHSQIEIPQCLDPQSTKPAQSPGSSGPASETTPKGPEPVTPRSKSDSSNDRIEKPEVPESKRQRIPQNPPKPAAKPLPEVITKFEDIPAHTAKCDTCNRRNSKGMIRCSGCGWQLCQDCRQKRGGDLSHPTFDCLHIEAPHLLSGSESLTVSPAPSQYQTPVSTSPEEQAGDFLIRGRYQTPVPRSPEEEAAGILVDMSSSPQAREGNTLLCSPSPSSKQGRSGPSKPTPSAWNTPRGTQSSAEDSDETTMSAPSSIELEGTLTPHDWVRRNPTRHARPSRVRFD
ncbi:unnamed protein product [Penicillium pancosmium]